MKKAIYLSTLFATALLISCGDSGASNEQEAAPVEETAAPAETEAAASTGHPDGLNVYKMNCQACHQANGKGLPATFPPLAKSDFLADKDATISQVLNGASGEMVVNGETFNGTMAAFNALSDQEIADVLNFVYNSWGNTADGEITPEEIAAFR